VAPPSQIDVLLRRPDVLEQIALALPSHITAERIARVALTEVRRNPKLAQCDPVSFLGALMQSAQLGLELGNNLGHAYLVPFFNKRAGYYEAQLIPGYRGLIDLARRSGQIVSISARVVYENDDFEYRYGLDEELWHKPARTNRGEMIYAYAVAKLKDGGSQFEVMSREEIDEIKEGSQD
jgi:recombination protein RecT